MESQDGNTPQKREAAQNPQAMPKIISLTPRWAVVSKPSGMLTVPGRSQDGAEVLQEWVRRHHSPIWTVHRLDRETSGVVLFARTEKDHREASLWFQKRLMKKNYHCLANGVPEVPFFKINEAIEGVPSMTQVEVKETYAEGFYAKVIPRTGRRHQIRIHLSQKGYPIWGDVYYQGPKEVVLGEKSLSISRVALHASLLELPTGEVFECPEPEDFSTWLSQLRERGSRA